MRNMRGKGKGELRRSNVFRFAFKIRRKNWRVSYQLGFLQTSLLLQDWNDVIYVLTYSPKVVCPLIPGTGNIDDFSRIRRLWLWNHNNFSHSRYRNEDSRGGFTTHVFGKSRKGGGWYKDARSVEKAYKCRQENQNQNASGNWTNPLETASLSSFCSLCFAFVISFHKMANNRLSYIKISSAASGFPTWRILGKPDDKRGM